MLGERFKWTVHTFSGGMVTQVAASGVKYSYEDLDKSDIKMFELHDSSTGALIVRVKFKPGERLVWRRRNNIVNDPEQGTKITETCHIVGKIGDGYKGVIGVFESDCHIEAVADFLPNSEWFYPPNFRNGENPDEE